MKEYKRIRHIYPVGNYIFSEACYSCGGDVDCENGFVDISRPPSKSYLCAKCAELQRVAQEVVNWEDVMPNFEVLINRAKAAFEEAQKGGDNGYLSMYVVIRDLIQFFEPSDNSAFNESGIFKAGLRHLQFGMLMMDPETDLRTLVRFAEEHGMKLAINIEGDAPDVQD